MAKALFVIDMQELTVGKNHSAMFSYPDDIVQKVNSVIGENEGNVIVYIRNLMKNNLINKIAPVKCFDGSKEAELAEGLSVRSKNVFDKYKGDAFSNPDLLVFLKKESVDEIEMVGVDGGGCVALTALGACEAGFKVRLNTSAIGTVFTDKRDRYYEKLRSQGAQIEYTTSGFTGSNTAFK